MEPECIWVLLLRPRPVPTPFLSYLEVFALTCLLEAPIYWFAFRNEKWSALKKLGVLFALNLATHPFIYFVVPQIIMLLNGKVFQSVLVSEIFAPVMEGILLYWLRKDFFWGSLGFAIATNLVSWWIGALIY